MGRRHVFQGALGVLVAFLVTEGRTAESEPLSAPSQGPQPRPGPEYKQMPLQMPLTPIWQGCLLLNSFPRDSHGATGAQVSTD